MTKYEAVMALIRDGHRLRQNLESNQRMIAALKTLGVEGEELLLAGYDLELWRRDGSPYLTRNPRSPSFAEADARIVGNGE